MNLSIAGMTVRGGKAFTIAADPEFEILSAVKDAMKVHESAVAATGPISFAAASVTALEIAVESAG